MGCWWCKKTAMSVTINNFFEVYVCCGKKWICTINVFFAGRQKQVGQTSCFYGTNQNASFFLCGCPPKVFWNPNHLKASQRHVWSTIYVLPHQFVLSKCISLSSIKVFFLDYKIHSKSSCHTGTLTLNGMWDIQEKYIEFGYFLIMMM